MGSQRYELMKPSHYPARLADKARANVASILTHALAEELLLSSTTREFYVNFPTFHSLHRLFADQYRQLERWLDQLAQRTWTMGNEAPAPMEELASARCVSFRERVPERTMIGELLGLHEELAKRLQDDERKCSHQLGDPGTADILRHLVEFHETTAWMLRTVLEGSASTPVHGR
jgi:starvation-inducible DNA-binding protein